MNDEKMKDLEQRLLNDPRFANELFPDVEVDEEPGYFSSYGSAPRIDIDDEIDTSDLDQAWLSF